jgi:hypothetical protein
VLDIGGRGLDEIRRTKQIGLDLDSAALERRAQFFDCRFEPCRHLKGIAAILLPDHEHDAWRAVDRGGTDARLRYRGHIGNVAKRYAGPAFIPQHGSGDAIGGQRLAFGLQWDTLVDGIDKPSAAHAGGSPRRREHVV